MRAYQKRVIFLKNTGSDSFEEAYFVISDKGCEEKSSADMVAEAKRIIKESFGKRGRLASILRPSNLAPFLFGGIVFSLVLLALYFTVL